LINVQRNEKISIDEVVLDLEVDLVEIIELDDDKIVQDEEEVQGLDNFI